MICIIIIITLIIIDGLLKPAFKVEANRYQHGSFITIYLLEDIRSYLLSNRSQSLAVSIWYDDDKSRGAFPSLILTFYLCYMPPNDIRSRGVVNWGCIFMTLVRRSVCNLYCPAGDTCSHVTKFYNTDSCKMLFLIVGSCRWAVVWWFWGNCGTSKSTSPPRRKTYKDCFCLFYFRILAV